MLADHAHCAKCCCPAAQEGPAGEAAICGGLFTARHQRGICTAHDAAADAAAAKEREAAAARAAAEAAAKRPVGRPRKTLSVEEALVLPECVAEPDDMKRKRHDWFHPALITLI